MIESVNRPRTSDRTMVGTVFVLFAAFLFLAACRSQGKPADLFFRSPAVSYISADGGERALNALQKVALGLNDRATVSDQGEGRLLFGDNLEVRIFRNSDIRFEGQVAEGATQLQKMRFEAGTTFATLNAQEAAAARLEIDTKWATIVALGTAYLTHYDRNRELTWVVVKEGQVQVTAGGKEITVGAAQQAWVEPGGTPVGPLPACREVVRDRFPLVEELTGNGFTDIELLPCPGGPPGQSAGPAQPAPPAQPAQPAKPEPAKPVVPNPPAVRPEQFIAPLIDLLTKLKSAPPPNVRCDKLAITGPGEGKVFRGAAADVRLSWTSVGTLGNDEYYRVLTDFPHNGETWQDFQYTTETSLALPSYLYEVTTGTRLLKWRGGVVRRGAPQDLKDDFILCSDTPPQTVVWGTSEEKPRPEPFTSPVLD